MNILFFTSFEPTLYTGGIERFALTLGNRFVQDGHSVVYVAKQQYNPDAPKSSVNHDVYVIPDSENTESDVNVNYVKNIVENYNIDIIFNQQADGVHIANLCHQVKSSVVGLKVVSILHFSPNHSLQMFDMPFEQILKYKVSTREKFGLLIRNTFIYKNKVRRYLHRIFTTVYEKSDSVVLLSEKSKPIFTALAGLTNTEKLYAMPNPVTNLYPVDVNNKQNKILYVGRCEILQKQINLLLDIWKVAGPKLPLWELDILGKGNYYEIAKDRIKKERIEHINLRGYCSPDEYYATSKILVLSSSTEGFPLVLLEAANLRTPSILFNSFEAASDIVVDGKTGYLIPPYDIELFADKLVELASDKSKLEQFSNNAYEHAQKFTVDEIIKGWYHIFNNVLK